MRIDHVLYAARDLDAAAARLEADHGLVSVAGGHHGAAGTANRLIPLGDQYVEIIAIVDPSSESPIAQAIRQWTVAGDGLAGVSLAVDDIEAVAGRIGEGVVDMTRALPDGGVIEFRVAGIGASIADRRPFFIEWGAGSEGRTGGPIVHPVGATAITWVDQGGDPDTIAGWLGTDVPGLRLVGGEPGSQACGIAIAAGELVLR